MKNFTPVLPLHELAEGNIRTVSVHGERVAITLLDGEPQAFQSLCPHDKAGLSEGRIEGCELHCPRHAARFNLYTGVVSAGWRVDDLKRYPARIRAGMIEIDAEAVRKDPPEGQKMVWDFS